MRERHDLLPREGREEEIGLRRKPEFYCICAATKSSIPIISDEVDDCARDMSFIKLEFNKGASIKYVRAEGEGECQRNAQFCVRITLIGCVKSVREGGRGSKKAGKSAYVLDSFGQLYEAFFSSNPCQ